MAHGCVAAGAEHRTVAGRGRHCRLDRTISRRQNEEISGHRRTLRHGLRARRGGHAVIGSAMPATGRIARVGAAIDVAGPSVVSRRPHVVGSAARMMRRRAHVVVMARASTMIIARRRRTVSAVIRRAAIYRPGAVISTGTGAGLDAAGKAESRQRNAGGNCCKFQCHGISSHWTEGEYVEARSTNKPAGYGSSTGPEQALSCRDIWRGSGRWPPAAPFRGNSRRRSQRG